MSSWLDNIKAWFCYTRADSYEHGVNGTRARFLAVVKALPHEFNRYVIPSMFTSDVLEPYEALKQSVLKRGDLVDRQRLDQLLSNIDLQHGSATDMLLRMREVLSVKEKAQTLRNDTTEHCHRLIRYPRIRHDRRRSRTHQWSSSRKRLSSH
ncbi:unnamed protein product [Schistosoma margrebowiei]|uniref:Uncharacterized protein n=1 Tax=Schistosoma margrebowiei TaxID=48269 RepID=A0A183NCH1_9TREM|nr:unnamed protein product [Schistosoma margrebowiei]